MKRDLFHIMFFLLLAVNANAQIWNIWYFGGGGGFDFNQDPPLIFQSPLRSGSDSQGYVCNTMCDSAGKLLFYFDGKRLFNANNDIIENGDSFNVRINAKSSVEFSSYYGSLLLPFPNNIYRLINIPDDILKSYSHIIDMNANSGNGKVISKNNCLYPYSKYASTCNIAAIHPDKDSYWVISKIMVDSILVFRVYKDSIVLKKINRPNIHNEFFNCKPDYYRHYNLIYLSFDQKLLVETITFRYGDGPSSAMDSSYIIFYDFDNQKGEISNMRVIKRASLGGTEGRYQFATIAFSPNDSFIYIGSLNDEKLVQLVRYAEEVWNSRYEYPGTEKWPNPSELRLAPDGKIYGIYHAAFQSLISVINDPDKKDIKSNFELNKYDPKLIYRTASYNKLPFTFYQDLSLKAKYINTCGNILFQAIYDTNNYNKITWYFTSQDSVSGKEVKFSFNKSGTYIFKYKAENKYGYKRWFTDTITFFTKPTANFSTDTTIGCQWLKFKFHDASVRDTVHPVMGESWLWDLGDGTTDTVQNPAHIYTKTGKYSVKLIYSNGFCTDTIEKLQTVEIIEAPKPGFDMSKTNYCSPYELKISDRSIGRVQSYLYDFGDSAYSNLASPSHLYPQPGDYKVRQILTGPTGCVTQDSAMLHLRKGFDGSETINSLTTNVMDDKSILVNWQSYPEAFSYDLYRAMSETGGYTKAANLSDTFFNDLSAEPMKKVFSYKITGFDSCQRPGTESRLLKNIVLTGETYGNEYSILYWTPFEMWQNGVKEYVLEYRRSADTFEWINALNKNTYRDNDYFSGTKDFFKCYRIRAIEKDGNSQQSISNELCLEYEAILWIPNTFTPNGDGLNDSFNISGIRIADFNIKIYDRWGLQVFEGNDPEKGWNGTCNGKNAPVDAYYYLITAKGEGGRNIVLKGTVSLVR